MAVLGIESSCDETAAAVIDSAGKVLSHQVASQIKDHASWGGVVPQIAARAHAEVLGPLVQKTLQEADFAARDLEAVAATAGPGLVGSVMLGLVFAKTMAAALDKPFLAINHLEGHALLPRLTNDVRFPYLLLLISGGHTQFFVVNDLGSYVLLGQSLDDALGETFDKVGRLLGLPYPGGPHIEKIAQAGNPNAFNLPAPLKGRSGCDFSFSGLKTAVALKVQALQKELQAPQAKADMAASFQHTIGQVLADRLRHAIKMARVHQPNLKTLVISGGVAANRALFQNMEEAAVPLGLQVVTPPPALCTDNGIMIAWAALERYQRGYRSPLSTDARARWPLSKVTLVPEEEAPIDAVLAKGAHQSYDASL